jgi:hypothetical protein
MFKRFISWITALFRKRTLYTYKIAEDVPDKMRDNTVYLISNQGYIWQCVMLCPCGCGESLYTNLMDDFDPYWKYVIEEKTISLKPSIDRLVGCKSHFFLTRGKISWC